MRDRRYRPMSHDDSYGPQLYIPAGIGGGKGGARGLKPPLGLLRGGLAPLRMISHRNYLSWSGAHR